MDVKNNIRCDIKGSLLQNHNRIFFSAGNFDCGIHQSCRARAENQNGHYGYGFAKRFQCVGGI